MGLSYSLNVDEKKARSSAKSILWRAVLKMQELATRKCPVDTGNLRTSIDIEPKAPGSEFYRIFTPVNYAADVEFGTSPHHVPIKSLEGWSKRKLGNEKLAAKISKGIAKNGTNAQPFFRPALFEVKNFWINKLGKV